MRLETTWATNDKKIAVSLKFIDDLPISDPARHELEAVLHTFQARLCWQRAEQLRKARQDSERRRAAYRRPREEAKP